MDKKWNHESLYPRMTVGVMGSTGGKIEAGVLLSQGATIGEASRKIGVTE